MSSAPSGNLSAGSVSSRFEIVRGVVNGEGTVRHVAVRLCRASIIKESLCFISLVRSRESISGRR